MQSTLQLDEVQDLSHSFEFIDLDSLSDAKDFLEHYGAKGQKWGNRRYQNTDGSLTPLGRIHYGVGEARESAGRVAGKIKDTVKSGTSKAKTSIRKTVNPSDEDLDEAIKKAQAKADHKAKVDKLRELQGKEKKLKDMTDQEVRDRFDRLQKEAAIRRMEKEVNQSSVNKFFNDYLKQGITRATNDVVSNAVKDMFAKEKQKSYAELLKEEKSKLELDILTGDDKKRARASEKLGNLQNAKGKDGNKKNKSDEFKSSDSAKDSGSQKSGEKAKVYGTWDPDTKSGQAARNVARARASINR